MKYDYFAATEMQYLKMKLCTDAYDLYIKVINNNILYEYKCKLTFKTFFIFDYFMLHESILKSLLFIRHKYKTIFTTPR